MSIRPHLSVAFALISSSALLACDKASHPSEAAAEEVSSQELPGDRAAAGATPYHFKTNGAHASLYTTVDQGEVFREIQLDVSATGTDQASVHYGIWECSLTTFECIAVEAGFGLVSGADLITSRDRITVNTNTAENPTFERWEGAGGPINVTWTQLSGWSHRSSSQSRYRDAGGSSHFHGTFITGPALAEGTVVGASLDTGSGYAQMGTVKEGGVSIIR
jgi:hypothetical protein